MTNFQSDTNRPIWAWLTPERAVVVLPILGGLALAATLTTVVITPQMVQLRERRSVVTVFEQKREALPGVVESLALRQLERVEVMAQQQRLLALIVGTSGLETFLAQLNDLADQYQVVVTSTQPGAIERASVPVVSIDAPAPAAAGAEDPVVVDPLLMKGLAKRSVRIAVEGPFVQVLDFLRSLEKLEIFVVTDDLSVLSARTDQEEAMQVRLGLTLRAYGVSQ